MHCRGAGTANRCLAVARKHSMVSVSVGLPRVQCVRKRFTASGFHGQGISRSVPHDFLTGMLNDKSRRRFAGRSIVEL